MSDPRFQWSKMSPDRSEQVVVRGDDYQQFLGDIATVANLIPTVAFPNDVGKPLATPPEQAQMEVPMCAVHNKPMRVGKYPGTFYCATKLQDGTWCKYKSK